MTVHRKEAHRTKNISLYLITDDRRSNGRPVFDVVAAAVKGGARLVQYRPAGIDDASLLKNARLLRDITLSAGCRLLISDRADIAILSGADGVHIGKNDIPIADARKLLGTDRLIGYSAHEPDEAARAQAAGADFITYSPVFPTTSHSKPRALLGVDMLKENIYRAKISIPVFPLGGIGLEQIEVLKTSGFHRAAVVTAVTEAPDVEQATRDILAALNMQIT